MNKSYSIKVMGTAVKNAKKNALEFIFNSPAFNISDSRFKIVAAVIN